jgi:hypothetical protein
MEHRTRWNIGTSDSLVRRIWTQAIKKSCFPFGLNTGGGDNRFL